MNFERDEEQGAIADMADKLFADHAEADDLTLWSHLLEAGIAGLLVSEANGGSGLGWLHAVDVLQAQGRHLAGVSLWPGLVASYLLDRHGNSAASASALQSYLSGGKRLTLAFEELTAGGISVSKNTDGTVTGCLEHVPVVTGGAKVLCGLSHDTGCDIWLLDSDGVGVNATLSELSNGESRWCLQLENAPIEPVAELSADERDALLSAARLAVSAMTLGVVEEALQRTARYTTERKQFGKPLAAFQAVSHRAADGYIDREALRGCVWQTAWILDAGCDAVCASHAAKWWACEAAHRISHTAQHLHGGVGADTTYPIHRYFLWSKVLEYTLGGAREHLNLNLQQLQADTSAGVVL